MGRTIKQVQTEAKSRLAAIRKVAASFNDLRPAVEVLTRVVAVPTCFIQFDHGVRVGGFPTERFSLVHGPSNHGKTTFLLGLVRSFLMWDHFVLWVDAERTTPFDWVEKMVGPILSKHPGFVAKRPDTYEKTIADVRNFCITIAEAKEKGTLPEDQAGLIVIDSIRKLVPASIMKQIEAENEKGKDADPSRRAAQIKAAMNANWLDELTPILERANIAMVVVARETEDPDANAFAKKFGTNYKIGGGKALYFDASLVMRVERASWVQKAGKSDTERATIYGERHRVTIGKTKVAGKDDKVVRTYFHTSNGVLVPEGFDFARDVLEMAEKFKVVEKSGSWYAYGNERIGNGDHSAVVNLYKNAENDYDDSWLARIAAEVRAKFGSNKPEEEAAGEAA